MKGLLLRGGKRWGKFRRQGSRKSLNLDCTSEMTLLPRKTSFRWKGISSLQAPKKKERRKKKERALRIKRGRLTKIERKKGSARKAVEGGVLHRRGEVEGRGGAKERKYSLPPPRTRPPFCEDEDTSRLLPDTSVRIQHLLPPSSSERLHGVCSDWAGDFSPCDERRGMSLRFEVISLFLEWSCLSATWIYYRNCFALVNWSHGFNVAEYRVFLLDKVIWKQYNFT